jgi:nucleoside-triphosphatase THEP1
VIITISGERTEGKTTLLKLLAELLRERHYACGGIMQPTPDCKSYEEKMFVFSTIRQSIKNADRSSISPEGKIK